MLGAPAELVSRGLFALSPFFAITYTDIEALIFFKIVIYMFEFSLKIVYNILTVSFHKMYF